MHRENFTAKILAVVALANSFKFWSILSGEELGFANVFGFVHPASPWKKQIFPNLENIKRLLLLWISVAPLAFIKASQ